MDVSGPSSSSSAASLPASSYAQTSSLNQKSLTTSTSGGQDVVEMAVVGSPELYGDKSPCEQNVCDIVNSKASNKDGTIGSSQVGTTSNGTGNGTSSSQDPSVTLLPRAPQSAFSDPRYTPNSFQMAQALVAWQWIFIDGVQLPCVMRGGERFLSVHMVQLKLLSKFPPGIPPEFANKYTMVSHKMSPIEVWIFNSINAMLRKFDFGCQLYTPSDELVRSIDVQNFYWNVKALNLERIIAEFDREMQKEADANNSVIAATIAVLKKQVQAELELVKTEVQRIDEELPDPGKNNGFSAESVETSP
ncbi:hypothetical protein WR25_13646 [Diploscapter pachys]|uniref:Uncharacterized protein n=1 Tax=Diploscapter pachys TaxID=2018661 RepID=A0A2A2KRJ3_9BILA|nr:hypothetical protein WR25_13646 [Diploscapter pachys]